MRVCVCSSTLTVTWSGTCVTTTRTSMRTATKTLLTTVPTSPTATRRTTTRTGRETPATTTMTTTASLMTGTTAGWCPTGTSWTLTVSVAVVSLNFRWQRGKFKSNVKCEDSHVRTCVKICENVVSTCEERHFNGISCAMFYFHMWIFNLHVEKPNHTFGIHMWKCQFHMGIPTFLYVKIHVMSFLKKLLTFSHVWHCFLTCKNISSHGIKRSYMKTVTSRVKRLISRAIFVNLVSKQSAKLSPITDRYPLRNNQQNC